MAKADLIAQAEKLGITVAEENTVKEIEAMIASKVIETGGDKAEEKAVPRETQKPVKQTGYERWRVDIKAGNVEKLKLVKAGIKITEEEAFILNEGVINGYSTEPVMYFLPE